MFRVTQRWYHPSPESQQTQHRVSGGSEAPAVLPTLSSSPFLFFLPPSELERSGCFSLSGRLPEASQEQKWAVQRAEHFGSRNESQPLVIMLWIINAEYQSAETLRAAAELSDSGPSWSCTQILNVYSPVQPRVCSGKPPNTFRQSNYKLFSPDCHETCMRGKIIKKNTSTET